MNKEYRSLMGRIGAALILQLVLWELLCERLFPYIDGLLYDAMEYTRYEVVSDMLDGLIYSAAFILPAMLLALLTRNAGSAETLMAPSLRKNPLPYIFVALGGTYTFAVLGNLIFAPVASVTGDWGNWVRYFGSAGAFVSYALTAAVVPAFVEELLFRGVIMSRLLRFGKYPAIFISAVLFGLMHQSPAQILYTTAAGILIGWAVVECGSVWVGIVIHLLNNFISVIYDITSQTLNATACYAVCAVADCLIFAGAVICGAYLLLRDTKRTAVRGVFGERCVLPCELDGGSALSGREALRGAAVPMMLAYLIINVLGTVTVL